MKLLRRPKREAMKNVEAYEMDAVVRPLQFIRRLEWFTTVEAIAAVKTAEAYKTIGAV